MKYKKAKLNRWWTYCSYALFLSCGIHTRVCWK